MSHCNFQFEIDLGCLVNYKKARRKVEKEYTIAQQVCGIGRGGGDKEDREERERSRKSERARERDTHRERASEGESEGERDTCRERDTHT